MFVEIVRLLIVLIATAVGYRASASTPMVGATLGAGVGYVAGGLAGRATQRVVGRLERTVRIRLGAGELLVGGFGALLGGGVGALVGATAVVLLPRLIGWPLFLLTVWVAGYVGLRLLAGRSGEILALLGLGERSRFASHRLGDAPSSEDALLLDSSVLVDGRLLEVVGAGLVRGDVLVARFVLDELQALADADDPSRWRRGRRGLEVLDALDEDRRIRVHIIDDDIPERVQAEAKLVSLAHQLRVTLVTVDGRVNGIAESEGVPVLDLARLAAGLRPSVDHGDRVTLRLVKPGREPGQAVGYLDDGSMVVVSEAADLIGDELEVTLVSSMRTSVGRMFFAAFDGEASTAETTSVGEPGTDTEEPSEAG